MAPVGQYMMEGQLGCMLVVLLGLAQTARIERLAAVPNSSPCWHYCQCKLAHLHILVQTHTAA
jgi:hypothetical protein